MAKIPLSEATAEQLRDYATLVLGLDMTSVRKNASAETIRAQILAAQPDLEMIESSVAAEPPAVGVRMEAMHVRGDVEAPQKPRMVAVTIARSTTAPMADGRVFLGVNGDGMLIKAGERVEIPLNYFEVLQNAVTKEPIVDEHKTVIGFNDVPQYAYTFHGYVD